MSKLEQKRSSTEEAAGIQKTDRFRDSADNSSEYESDRSVSNLLLIFLQIFFPLKTSSAAGSGTVGWGGRARDSLRLTPAIFEVNIMTREQL